MERVIITKPIFGIFLMQVCAISNATDEEILEVCNRENPSGTERGWGYVIRQIEDKFSFWMTEKHLPVTCKDNPDRTHFLVGC